MANLNYKSATPFMPQGSEKVTKLIVVMEGDGVPIDDVIPFIGSGQGKCLTNENGPKAKVQSSTEVILSDAIFQAEQLVDALKSARNAQIETGGIPTLRTFPTDEIKASLEKVEGMKKEFPIKGTSETV